ncbi:MAG: DUF134 domain-containing protein [Candidatus Omnitrophota bacterium]
MRGRPVKIRNVRGNFRVVKFSPRGIRGRPDMIKMRLEEAEAIRLADNEGISHKEASALMGISRQTFERVLKRGRHAVSDALVNGKIIMIEGGAYRKVESRVT